MGDCATSRMRFETPAKLALEAAFDGGRITSDGGLTWLAEVDKELGVCQAMAEHIPEWRSRRGRHSMLSLLKQRVYQIACGYEDQNDSNFLRSDPLLKLVCGALPESGEDLASQPTICRMENAVTNRACYQMARALAEPYIAQRGKDGAPQKILLDFDATDDPTHGDQEESYYHGYFKEHIYHPLLVFDGNTGQLLSALLRAGNTHASRSTVALLKHLVGLLRSAWPGVEVELRADASLASPLLYFAVAFVVLSVYCGIVWMRDIAAATGRSERHPIYTEIIPNMGGLSSLLFVVGLAVFAFYVLWNSPSDDPGSWVLSPDTPSEQARWLLFWCW